MGCLFFSSSDEHTAWEAFKVSAKALASEVKFHPYYDQSLQSNTLSSFFAHLCRTFYNALYAAYNLAFVPIYLLWPCGIFKIPCLLVDVALHTIAAGISLVSTVIAPVIFCLRTITSMCFGYTENSKIGGQKTTEEADLDAELLIWPSADEDSDSRPSTPHYA